MRLFILIVYPLISNFINKNKFTNSENY